MLVMDFVPSDDKRYRYGDIYPNIKYTYLGYAIVADLFNLDHNIILKLCNKKLKPDLIKPWRLDGDGNISHLKEFCLSSIQNCWLVRFAFHFNHFWSGTHSTHLGRG